VSIRAATATVKPVEPAAVPPLVYIPTDKQVRAFGDLLRAAGITKNDLPAVAQAHTSKLVWCELRKGANGTVARADYPTDEVLALGDSWAADAVARLTQGGRPEQPELPL
jgi:hypothetical protein